MAGRQSKWEQLEMDKKLETVGTWFREGATEKDIAERLGVAVTTLNVWKKEHPEFIECLRRNKEYADVNVENALYKRAVGYYYDEVTFENGVEVKRVRKYMAPDTTACIYWLKNRKPNDWRDRREADVNEADRGNIEQLTEAILRSAKMFQ